MAGLWRGLVVGVALRSRSRLKMTAESGLGHCVAGRSACAFTRDSPFEADFGICWRASSETGKTSSYA